MARRMPLKSSSNLASIQSDINISPFAAENGHRGEPGTIAAFPGSSPGLPVFSAPKGLTSSVTKEAADTAAYNRVKSIDIARGATVGLMIFVNHAGAEPWWVHHAAWDGLHLADLVMPCFLLLVGISAALSLTSQRQRGAPRHALLLKVLKRAGRMALLGLLIQGGIATESFPAWDLSRLRYFGVLQRIALCFLLASLVVIYLPDCRPSRAQEWLEDEEPSTSLALIAPLRFHAFWWSFALAVFAAFTGMALLLTPPGCSERPAQSPACNTAAWVDQWLMGRQHLYPFPSCRHAQPPCPFLDPEGLFTTLGGASISTFIGLWYGTVLLMLRTHRARLRSWAIAAALLCETGYALHLTGAVPINKNMYSASYVLVTAGISGAFLCILYMLTDIAHSRLFVRLALPFHWLGMNAIVVYFGDEVLEKAIPWVFWGSRDAHLLSWIEARFVALFGPGWPSNLALALADVAFWMAVAGVMHRKRWYFKV